MRVFELFFTEPFKCKSLFQTAFYYTRKLKNKRFIFKRDFYDNIKMKKCNVGKLTVFVKHCVFVEVKELKTGLRE